MQIDLADQQGLLVVADNRIMDMYRITNGSTQKTSMGKPDFGMRYFHGHSPSFKKEMHGTTWRFESRPNNTNDSKPTTNFHTEDSKRETSRFFHRGERFENEFGTYFYGMPDSNPNMQNSSVLTIKHKIDRWKRKQRNRKTIKTNISKQCRLQGNPPA